MNYFLCFIIGRRPSQFISICNCYKSNGLGDANLLPGVLYVTSGLMELLMQLAL